MPKLDRVAELAPQLASLLAPGEQLRAACHVQPADGEDEAENAARSERFEQVRQEAAARREAQPHSGLTKFGLGAAGALGAVAGVAAGGASPFNVPMPEVKDLRGKVLAGGQDSAAVYLRDLLGGATSWRRDGEAYLVPTDRRVFVVRDHESSISTRPAAQAQGRPAAPYEVLGDLASSWIRAVAKAPRLLQRGRVRFDFWDGSMIIVNALLPSNADALVAATPVQATPPGPVSA